MTGHRWQYGTCALHAGYLRLLAHIQNMQYLLLCHCNNGRRNAPLLRHTYIACVLCSCDRASWVKREERKPTRCNNIDDLLSVVNVDYWHCLNMFRASLCPYSGERPRVTARGVYLLVVLDVAGCGTVVLCWGCEHCEGCCRVWALWRLLFDCAVCAVEQQPSQWSHPQHSTTVPQRATSSTTSKCTPHAVTRGLSPEYGHKDARNMLR